MKSDRQSWYSLLVAFFLGVGGTFGFVGLNNRMQPATIYITPPPPTAVPTPLPTPGPISIFVNGEVIAPGVYEVPYGSRLETAIAAAGGFTGSANVAVVNLALLLQDGSQVYVPAKGETAVVASSLVTAPLLLNDTSSSGAKVNLNTATKEALETLPGIGPSTAQKILDHRDENGPFQTIEGIMDVSGIGPAKFDKIKELITIEG